MSVYHKELTELAKLVLGDGVVVTQHKDVNGVYYKIWETDYLGWSHSQVTTVSQVASVLLKEMLTRADKFCELYFKLMEQEYDE